MNRSPLPRAAIQRREFIALGGAGVATAALAGCGSGVEEPSAGRDVELLGAALVGEENAAMALESAASSLSGGEAATVKALGESASKLAAELQDAIAALGDTPAEGEFGVDAGDGGDAALEAAVDSTNAAVQQYRLGAGQLSDEDLRASAFEWMSIDAVRLSTLYGLLGRQESPEAFVTGLDEQPYTTDTSTTTSTTETETETTSSSTTTSTAETTSTESTTAESATDTEGAGE